MSVTEILAALCRTATLLTVVVVPIPATYKVLPIPYALPGLTIISSVIPPPCLSTFTFAVAC